MVEVLPKELPEKLAANGKTFCRVGPDLARQWGITRSTAQGWRKWHYYLSQKAFTTATKGGAAANPGLRRHFTIFIGAGGKRASIHISLKAAGAKRGEGSFWFDYDRQEYSRASCWRNIPLKRTEKAETLLVAFVSALTTSGASPSKTLTPPPNTAWTATLPEAIEEDPWVGEDSGVATPKQVLPTFSGGSTLPQGGSGFDNWEDLEEFLA